MIIVTEQEMQKILAEETQRINDLVSQNVQAELGHWVAKAINFETRLKELSNAFNQQVALNEQLQKRIEELEPKEEKKEKKAKKKGE